MSVGDCHRYKSIRVLLSCLSLLLLAANVGCGGSSSLGPGSPTKALTAIAASPGTASISVGATEQFNAMATYSDGSTANVTASARRLSSISVTESGKHCGWGHAAVRRYRHL